MVGVSGFEPEASWTRTKRDTKLRHTPICNIDIILKTGAKVKHFFFVSGIKIFFENSRKLLDNSAARAIITSVAAM